MTACRHRRYRSFVHSTGSPSAGVKLCLDCPAKFFLCAFCDATEPVRPDSEWRYFAHDREQQPTTFPIDYATLNRERREWLCCPACFAESGEAAILRYLNDPRAMHPEPSYVCVYRNLFDRRRHLAARAVKPAGYKPVPISAAKAIAEQYDKQQVIVVAWDAAHGKTHVTTYGDTAEACRQAALGGDKVKDALGWPPDQRAVPTLARLVAMERRLREAIASDAACFEDDPTDTLRKILGEDS